MSEKPNNIEQLEQEVKQLIDEQCQTLYDSEFNEESIISYIQTLSDIDNIEYIKFYAQLGLMLGLNLVQIDSSKKLTPFGYKNVFKLMAAPIAYYNWLKNPNKITETNEEIEGSTLAKLVAYTREDIDKETFLTDNKYYYEDIKTLHKLLISKEISRVDDNDCICKVEIEQVVNTIWNRYNHVLEERYAYMLSPILDGIEKYNGVITLDGIRSINQKTKHAEAFTKVTSPMFLDALNSSMKSYNIIEDSTHHQFDIEVLYNNCTKNLPPTYFPYKILELASAMKYTSNGQVAYQNLEGEDLKFKSSFKEYYKAMTPLLKKLFREYVYYALYKYCVNNNDSDTEFVDKNDRISVETFIKDTLIDEMNNQSWDQFLDKPLWLNYLRKYILYLIDSMTTGFILAKYVEEPKKDANGNITNYFISEFRVKNSASIGTNTDSTITFVTKVFNSPTAYDEQKDVSGDVKESITDTSDANSNKFKLQDYGYIPDEAKATALPLFAYKALMSLQQKNANGNANQPLLSWDKIMLGRNDQDKIIYAITGEKIGFAGHNATFIIAGSRSGKGVMTYNLLTTAIGSNRLLFYCDGKPDTAVALRGLSQQAKARTGSTHEIFCLDNAILNSKSFDPDGKFDTPTRGWGAKYINTCIPPYLQGILSNSDFGIISYYRGAMLPYAMTMYADYCNTHNITNSAFTNKWNEYTRNNELGPILVLDEISIYMESFLADFGKKGKYAGLICSSDNITKLSKGIKQVCNKQSKEIAQLNAKLAKEQSKDKPDTGMIEQMQTELNDLIEAQSNISSDVDLFTIYMSDLQKSMKANAVWFESQTRASSKVGNVRLLVIGQDFERLSEVLDADTATEAGLIERADKGWQQGGNLSAIPWLYRICTIGTSDAIIGYNGNFPHYGGADKLSTRNHFTMKKRGFGHVELGRGNLKTQIDTYIKQPTQEIVDNKYSLFRPYLILNDAVIPEEKFLFAPCGTMSPELAANDSARKQIRESGGIGQYVAQCVQNVENAMYGVGASKNATDCANAWEKFCKDNAPLNVDNSNVAALYANQTDRQSLLNKGVGVEGYMELLSAGADYDPIVNMSHSGELADLFIREVFDYNKNTDPTENWKMFIDDMNPEYLIDIKAIADGGKYNPNSTLSGGLLHESMIQAAQKVFTSAEDRKALGSLASYYFTSTNNSVSDSDINTPNQDIADDVFDEPNKQNTQPLQQNIETNIDKNEQIVKSAYDKASLQISDFTIILPWEKIKPVLLKREWSNELQVAKILNQFYLQAKNQINKAQETPIQPEPITPKPIQNNEQQASVSTEPSHTPESVVEHTEPTEVNYEGNYELRYHISEVKRLVDNALAGKLERNEITVEDFILMRKQTDSAVLSLLKTKYNISLTESDLQKLLNSNS